MKRYAYTYDLAANRTTEQIDDAVTLSTYDVMNRLVRYEAGGPLKVAGIVSEPATVSVQGVPAAVGSDGYFSSHVVVSSGTSRFSVEGVDVNGNVRRQHYDVDVVPSSQNMAYDVNGNLISDGWRLFEWNARNQLSSVTVGTRRSDFMYDGEQRRVRVVEKESGVTQADMHVVWCTSQVCESRTVDGIVTTRRLFADGEQVGGSPHFFATDHLGSVVDVSDASATSLGRYTFDTWGRRTLVAGADVTPIGFTGQQSQGPGGLWQTWYRAYDPDLGRWISEDPAGLVDGPNRHAYVRNNPVRYVDPDGRQAQVLPIIVLCSPDPVTKGAMIAAGVAAGAVIIYKACEDGNCFGNNDEKERNRERSTCQRLVELCLQDPWQAPHRQKQWGKRKDCGACFRECVQAGGAWPFYKCPIF